jgi:predicted nucleotidyltransferase
MGIEDELKCRRAAILRLRGAHGARNPRLFGSVARGQAGETSDVYLVVEMEPGRTLFDLGGCSMTSSASSAAP